VPRPPLTFSPGYEGKAPRNACAASKNRVLRVSAHPLLRAPGLRMEIRACEEQDSAPNDGDGAFTHADVPAFIAAQCLGAGAATVLFRWLVPALPEIAPHVVVPHSARAEDAGFLQE